MYKPALTLIFSGCFLVLAAASSIGTVKSSGEFRVDGAAIRGNGTLFEGDLVETAGVRSVVQLGGTQLTLLPASRAKVYHDRTVIEKGSGLLTGAAIHSVEAASLRITPVAANAVLQVDVAAPNRVAVTARNGSAEVRNASGVLVASLRPGVALAFEPQTGASQMRLRGTVTARDGKYFLTDTTANVTVELQGSDVKKYVGRKVELTGSPIPNATPGAGASQVVQVLSVNVLAAAAAAAGAGAAGAGAAAAGAGAAGAGAAAAGAGAAAAAGISTAATVAIIGGVAVGGTVGGMAAANAGPFSDNPPVSNQ
jgi:hypothetical protein